MGSSKRGAPLASKMAAKERHRKAQRMLFDPKTPLPAGLVAKPMVPKLKHRTYFEIMENKDKKKKLEFKVTTDKKPPPGFEFVPMGNPELTTACKELSREKDAMIFIVSSLKDAPAGSLSHQVHRIGHHIRESIVEEARAKFDVLPMGSSLPVGRPEPIPTSQTQYNAQVDAAIRDLFPRIPNTDRQIIIEHSFDLSAKSRKGEKPVGLSADITLARRVQLAVLAHIRHTHTRYDDLRKETTWVNARRVVEALCLDILVKWRGDEETGRDQLDEILQEVVVISDSEDSEDDEADESALDSDSSVEIISPPARPGPLSFGPDAGGPAQTKQPLNPRHLHPNPIAGVPRPERARAPGKKEQRGFKRYRAWQEAIQRSRAGEHIEAHHEEQLSGAPIMYKSTSHGPYPHTSGRAFLPAESHNMPQSKFGAYLAEPSHGHEISSPEISFESRALFNERRPLDYGLQPRMESAPPQRPLSPPIQDRFKDLLVQSIEQPNSPEVISPSFVRPIPSKSPELRNFVTLYEDPARPPPGIVGNVPVVNPQGSPHDRRGGEQLRHQAGFPGGFIQVSRRIPGDAHPPHLPGHGLTEPSVPQSRVRPRGNDRLGDGRPAKRPQLEPSPLARPPDRFYMEDRGGFYEKVLLHPEGSRSVPPDPGFIVIRRQAEPEIKADRVVSFEEGRRLRHERGVEIIPLPHEPNLAPGHAPYRAPLPVYQPLDHLPLNPYHGSLEGTTPVHQSRPQRVFRYVRGSGPNAQYPPFHQPFDFYPPPHHGVRPVQTPAREQYELSEDQRGDGPRHRSSGRHSYTPIVLD
ncbi:hypothetical protein NLU13_6190 [Sarocladium strictum]|uniref:DUF2293 domain-containing protein n=1 Tax=Sarocladium strictum TaxID=5046 RepID=A0AA39GGQ4_SARSR|nr:hypothetical protein NLU13_6190 [Sarocladium strictum]